MCIQSKIWELPSLSCTKFVQGANNSPIQSSVWSENCVIHMHVFFHQIEKIVSTKPYHEMILLEISQDGFGLASTSFNKLAH